MGGGALGVTFFIGGRGPSVPPPCRTALLGWSVSRLDFSKYCAFVHTVHTVQNTVH